MPDPHWSTIAKDLVTAAGLLIGGSWAAWKWGYGETLRKRREMASPDGTLTATAVQLENGTTAITLHALWRNRGPLPIELCPEHSAVEAFKIDRAVPLGGLALQPGPYVVLVAVSRPRWNMYIMEPTTDSVMHEHFVLDDDFVYGFRWTICLAPGSISGKHGDSHLVCTRELIWRNASAPLLANKPSNKGMEPTR